MKRKISGYAALLLSLALFLALPAAALTLGDPIGGYDTPAAQGTELARGVWWTGSDYRMENYIERAPDSGVRPIAVGWETLCSRDSLAAMAERMEAEGLHVLAGVNGDYFNMRSGVPAGIAIENGVLRSSCDGVWAVGFQKDGSTLISKPALDMRVEIDGTEYPVTSLNKARGEAFVLYTEDFATTTKTEGAGKNFICAASEPITAKCEIKLRVESCLETETASLIPAGKLILSLSAEANEWMQGAADAIEAGSELTLRIDCAEGWETVDSAVGCLYKLVTDAKPEEGLERTLSPRSAVGIKADGTLLLYTIDGRQSGLSVGASLRQVAERLIELGCVEAGVLDGGASTSLCAVRPGETQLTQINSPSEGAPRDAANYILLVTDAEPSGRADKLTLYPLEGLNMLVGASAPISIKASDENGYAALIPVGVRQTVYGGVGTIRSGRFHAEQAGEGNVTASLGTMRSEIPIHVVTSPDKLTVYGEKYGREIENLTLEPGQEVDLRAEAELGHIKLIADDSCFTWELEEAAGTVDETGHLTASESGGAGILSVSAGETRREIKITVLRPIPFQDVSADDWYYEAVRYAYENNLFNGVADDSFAPQRTMTRAMLVTVLWRIAGEPAHTAAALFEDVAENEWYTVAIAWAAEAGIVEGVSETRFAPTSDLTREQVVTMLQRYHRFVENGDAFPNGELSVYPDAEEVSGWALESVTWAVGAGILIGRNGTLSPRADAIRAEVADILMRFLT